MADIFQTPTEDITTIEYRVRRVSRYVVTRFVRTKDGQSGSHAVGEFSAWDNAYGVGYALADQEAKMRGLTPDDPRIVFPGPAEQVED